MKIPTAKVPTIIAVIGLIIMASGLSLIAWALLLPAHTPFSSPLETPTVPPPYDPFPDWIICWHGRGFDEGAYEFLVAYPEAKARSSEQIQLTNPLKRPWLDNDPNGTDAGNDSLKMCYFEGAWYGGAEPWESALFPRASHLRIINDRLQVCDDFCDNETNWSTLAESGEPDPPLLTLLSKPVQGGTHILSYFRTDN